MNVAILGFGTIGGGLEILLRDRSDLKVKRIFSRHVPEAFSFYDSDFETILQDPDIDVVAEALGGVEPAFTYLCAAIQAGKHVVTANKAVVAAHYRELADLALHHGVAFRFSASVGGGIAWLPNMERLKRADDIHRLGGIMNGTCNLILSRMIRQGKSFGEALAEAQAEGYAEKDPSDDIDGLDARRKLVLSANSAFDCVLPEEDVPAFGIRHVSPEDIRAAQTRGASLRLCNWAFREDDKIRMLTAPAFVPLDKPEASVWENGNIIYCHGKIGGEYSFGGLGAGRFPTALSMVQDLLDITQRKPVFYQNGFEPCRPDNSGWMLRWYIRDARGARITDPTDAGEMIAQLQARLAAGEKLFAAVVEE